MLYLDKDLSVTNASKFDKHPYEVNCHIGAQRVEALQYRVVDARTRGMLGQPDCLTDKQRRQ